MNVNEVDHYLRNVDNEVVLPTNTKVRILMTASDVIHAWWVPELGGKKDAIPGFINELWVNIKELFDIDPKFINKSGYSIFLAT